MNKVEKINDLHERAMNIAEEVYLAQRKQDNEEAKKYAKQSFELERAAAMLMVDDYDIEPTRSVLFKGAACLAINAEMYREAEQMIGFALTGNPPIEVAEELRALLLEINSRSETKQKSDLLISQLLTNQINQLSKESQLLVKEFVEFLISKNSKRA